MPGKPCREMCKGEKIKKGKTLYYSQGMKHCIDCEVTYKPEERTHLQIVPNPNFCYCCRQQLRSKPKTKKYTQELLVRIV